MDKCPSVPGGINSNSEMNGCSIAPSVDEPIWGMLDKLPGCNDIQYGPGEAHSQTGCGATTSLSTPVTQHTDMTPEKWQYVGCFTDMVNGVRVFTKASKNAYTSNIVPMSVESCITFCGGLGFSMAGLEDGNQCWCDNAMNVANGAGVASGLCDMPCSGNGKQVCGGALGSMGYISIYQKCSGTCANPVAESGTKTSRRSRKRRSHRHLAHEVLVIS